MDLNINYDRANTTARSMEECGAPRHEAVALAMAFEFAAVHPDFAHQFGTFTQNYLNEALVTLTSKM